MSVARMGEAERGESPLAASAEPIDATILFSDAVDYSGATERDPLAARDAIRLHVGWEVAEIRRRGGRVISVAGDGVMAAFDAPGPALAAADAFQRRVAEANREAGERGRMRFRVGIARGKVFRERNPVSGEEEFYGPTVIVAARLEQGAEPGAVNFDDAVAEAAEALGLGRRPLGYRKLKGIDAPVRVWRLALPGDELRVIGEGGAAHVIASQPLDARRARSVAVLRFEMRGGGEDDGWFAEAVSEDVIDGLSRSRWLFVTSARSSFALSGGATPIREIADRLKVRYLVDGSVRRGGGRVRIAARLIDCETDEVVWSARYDRDATDLFALQDQIAGAVTASLEPAFLRNEETRAARPEPRDLQHWDLLMRARWHFWRSGKRHAMAAYETAGKALALGPDDAETHAFLSFVNMTMAWSGLGDPRDNLKAALTHATRAVELDDTNANAHFTLGTALSCVGRLDEAIGEERRALALNPHFSAAMGELGRLLAFRGASEEARLHLSGAETLSPQDPTVSLWRRSGAIAAFVDDDLDEAVRRQGEAVAARPDWFFHHYLHAGLLAEAGRVADAQVALGAGRKLVRRYPSAVMRVGHPFGDEAHFGRLLRGLRAVGWDDDRK
ncbi:MAG: adenylate/guanylate cyclase domain-containing protein [Paracoccaceae bacterium]